MFKALKKKKVYISIIVVALIVTAYMFRSGNGKGAFTTTITERKDLTQEITVSGAVKSKEAVELGFEKTGKVKKIFVDVGNMATRGQVLISQENTVEFANVEDAKAKLASKGAHYDDLKAGGRPEEISVKESGLAKAKSDLATYYASVQNIILDAFNKADNATHRQADILFSNALSSNPQLTFNSSDQQAVLDAQGGRFMAEAVLTELKNISQSDMSINSVKEEALKNTKEKLLSINDFLIKTNRALNSAINLSDATLATDKDALNTARTNINTAITNVTDQIQAIATQKITVQTSADELALAKAPATTEVLSGALADIQSAEANVMNAEALLAKTYIVSPIGGIITKQDAKVGEISSANSTLVSVQSDNFKVEAFIPEVDVAKLAIGNSAIITLDAYGSGVEFQAHVIKIDPAETVIDGVPTYKTTLEFDKVDSRIRSGMTANTTIITATRESALSVPQRAVFEKNGKKFVRTLDGPEKTLETEVVVGIRGSNGEIEIISGLTEGMKVIVSGQTK